MKKAGIYIHKKTGVIWLCDKVEYYEKSITGTQEMSIIVSGLVDGKQEIKRCLITGKQYKMFKRIGSL